MSNNLNLTKVLTPLQSNCSSYNPCGPYGNCEDNSQGQWTCDCKFWWKGISCKELSTGGKQVVALGVITGILIILFYSLALIRWIHKKRNEPIKPQQISTTPRMNRKSSTVPVTTPNLFRRIFPWIIGILILLVGLTALIIKWIILKTIHKEIIDKFHTNQSLYYNRSSICRLMYIREEFNLFTFPIACLLVLLFTIRTKRESTKYCQGYFALPIPLNFFAHTKRTFYAIVFAMFADDLAKIARELINGNTSSTNDGVIVIYLLQIVKVIIITFRYYPILAAVYINTRFTLISASIYAWLHFIMTIAFQDICRNDYYPANDMYTETDGEDTRYYLKYYGTGSMLIFFQLLTDIPRYLFLAYVCIQLLVLLYKQIQKRKLVLVQQLTYEENNLLQASLPDSIETRYVENLFGLGNVNRSTNRFIQMMRVVYGWRDDFRYSSRVLCVYASILVLLFFLTVQTCVQVPPYLHAARTSLEDLFKTFPTRRSEQLRDSSFAIPDFVPSYLVATFTAHSAILIQLIFLLVSIRRNLLQVFRGNDSEIPKRESSQNLAYAWGNIHFAGYLIAYVIWGYVLILFFVMLIGTLVTIIVTYKIISIVESILKIAIPGILLALFQIYLNKILAQYIFLQHGGEVLSIKHRRILMVFLYFNFFLDALLGFISSAVRILKSMIVGVVFMCRLDYSSMGRKLEKYEPGFSSYCGFIHMECAHRHPVLLFFTSHLLRQQLYRSSTNRQSKARRRWYLAVFLLKNPTMIYRRNGFSRGNQIDNAKMMLITRRMDMKQSLVLNQETTA